MNQDGETKEGRLARALIVDDQPDFADFMKMVAVEQGFDVQILTHSPDFDQVMASWRPNVIALDIMMPGRDGLEILESLAEDNYPGHLILMSGADPLYLQMAAGTARARGLRLAGVLVKPCRKEEVGALLQSLLGIP